MGRRGGSVAAAIASALALAIPLSPAAVAAGTRAAEPALEERDCGQLPPIDVEVTCSWLYVPERHGKPDGKAIRLAVAVMHSRSATPEPDPVVFLHGGPGGEAIEGLENFATSPMLETRDIVLVDQRGAGISEPSLDCAEREEAILADLGRAEDPRTELESIRVATRACRKRLTKAGVDLAAYNTVESAADIAALRVALGVDEWNLYGVSYGTRLALEVMRSQPKGVRSVVLDSVYPPDIGGLERQVTGAHEALDRLFAACEEDAACAAAHPDLERTFTELVDRVNDDPIVARPDVGPPTGTLPLEVTGDDLFAALYNALYDHTLIPALPGVIETLARGDSDTIIQALAQAALGSLRQLSTGAFLSVDCADAAEFSDPRPEVAVAARDDDASVVARFSSLGYCADWKVKPLPDSFSFPVRSRIPTLVFAGSLDPVTPATDSRKTAGQLRNATYIEMPGYGHAVTRGTQCPGAIRQQFLGDPGAELDTSCVDAIVPTFT